MYIYIHGAPYIEGDCILWGVLMEMLVIQTLDRALPPNYGWESIPFMLLFSQAIMFLLPLAVRLRLL